MLSSFVMILTANTAAVILGGHFDILRKNRKMASWRVLVGCKRVIDYAVKVSVDLTVFISGDNGYKPFFVLCVSVDSS